MKKTIGILAHVDAGKTTFAEQLLYHTNSIRERGRVDHKDSFFDSHDIEKNRGITVFSEQGLIQYKGVTYHLIDTPGHVDFSPEMERSIQIMDYAILIISAVEGVEGHTETVWSLLEKYNVPTFIFINKTDRVGANVKKVMKDINENLSEHAVDITETFVVDKKMDDELIEFIAERDERILDYYLEKGYEHKVWMEESVKQVRRRQIFPCCSGSALHDVGVVSFFEKFHQLTSTSFNDNLPFSGRVYKIRHEMNGLRVTYIKVLTGSLKVRESINLYDGEETISEKITQLRIYNGNKYSTVDEVHAGDLVALTGISTGRPGDGIGHLKESAKYEMIPTLKSKVNIDSSINIKEAYGFFKLLDREDPSLQVLWDEKTQEIHIHVMGVIQLEVLTEVIKERFQLHVSFEKPEILYKETIKEETYGYGHFEPLGHYAEVHLKMEPIERNKGILFENVCHANDLSIGNQHLIQQHIFERDHHGLLTGSPLTDVKVTLLTGRAHNKHTSGGDFREATYRAIRQGLEKIKSVLLEPYYSFKIKVDMKQMGRILSDIQYAHGSFNPPETFGEKVVITGEVPVATFMDYHTEFVSITHGKGTMNLVFSGYGPCHNEKDVVERIGYDKNADAEYTSTSIFCSKGQGYTVKWEKAEEEMHCL
ncbi:TetM/TetW/TetO/TetS family tetracycline resistance ribosomal protection protein [Evansella sp. AB-P1]|uniref:GTP-binding protein n=1 Tax=Evansella sp. AB-P1 TaxID=3037653 RepID=UPI00241C6256|nr:TetM/TetW/TetO/TetS family tetracycline resistance ribosomal protection protein [Evansella sp. AB-P1]MDG5786172.1 TetM/TetW/TetO/TetS family tetracycline resistance ribosomal protection protein [Evansella sp. AB-P1]